MTDAGMMRKITDIILTQLRNYKSDKRGNYSILFAYLLFPLIVGTGMAVDMTRRVKADRAIQDALDSAALYAATLDYETTAELEEESERLFSENLKGRVDFEVTSFKAIPGKEGTVKLDAVGKLDSFFMQIGGVPNMDISAKAEAIAQSDRGIELVIAFDTTASMGFGSSWDDATDTLDKVLTKIEQWTGHEGFFVTLVPFSDRVRIGTSRASWLDSAAPSGWNGCVEPREEVDGTFLWASDEDVPSDEPFQASIPGVTGGLAGVFGNGPHCPSVAVTGPTSDVDTLIAAADNLSTNGGTGRFDDAMAWTWRLLSPKWSGLWSASEPGYPTNDLQDRRKVVIYVTDGRTEAYTHELSQERSWNWNQGSEVGFEHMVHVCDQMKAEGIEIYMFRVTGNNNAASYIQSCASDPNTHYKVISNNSQLELAFLDVMRSIKVEMHITR